MTWNANYPMSNLKVLPVDFLVLSSLSQSLSLNPLGPSPALFLAAQC
jgi:hypothetical protein